MKSQKILFAILCMIGSLEILAQQESIATPPEVNSAPVESNVPSAATKQTQRSSMDEIEYQVHVESQEARFNLGVYSQLSQFELLERSLTGNAFEVTAGYAILPKVTMTLGITQAVDTSNGLAVLFTGIRTSMAYHILGEAYKKSSILNVNGRSTISFLSGLRPTLATDFGIDQYLFNGTSQVIPATGFSVGTKFDHSLWILRLSWMARFGSLVIAEESVSLMTFGLGVVYRF